MTAMKILVPLDGSKSAEAAIAPATRLAAETQGQVHLVCVVSYEKAHIIWARNYTPEGASHSYLDLSGTMPSDLVEGPKSPLMVESRGQAL